LYPGLESATRFSERDFRSPSFEEVMGKAQYYEGQLKAINRRRRDGTADPLILLLEECEEGTIVPLEPVITYGWYLPLQIS
jgi:hypothetical protein